MRLSGRRWLPRIINGGKRVMHFSSSSATSRSAANRWLVKNGPSQLELLFRSIVYHPSAPVLVNDDQGNSNDTSVGASKVSGLPREPIIGRPVDDFAVAGSKPPLSEIWRALQDGEQAGSLGLLGAEVSASEVEPIAKGGVLPVPKVHVPRDP